MPELPRIPGFVDAHCHAFQRALRGRAEGADFWAWRETMLELAAAQTPERVRREYVDVYRELRAAGYTAVGEFHYLGLDEARAAAEAATEAGVELVSVRVGRMHDGRARAEAAALVEQLDRPHTVLGEALLDLARLLVGVDVQRQLVLGGVAA